MNNDDFNFTLQRVNKTAEYKTTTELLNDIEALQNKRYTIFQLTGFLSFVGYTLKAVRRGKRTIMAWNCTVRENPAMQPSEYTQLFETTASTPDVQVEELAARAKARYEQSCIRIRLFNEHRAQKQAQAEATREDVVEPTKEEIQAKLDVAQADEVFAADLLRKLGL